MKLTSFKFILTSALVLTGLAHAQHGHLDVGATSTNRGAQLIWQNGAAFVETSGYVKTLLFTNAGRYSNYYNGSITLTALPRAVSGGHPQAPAYGSQIKFSLRSIDAPAGGIFAYWDSNSIVPTVSLAKGEASSNRFFLSANTGGPNDDPYGHIHGRRFTATRPGIYKVGFTAWDTSTNGDGGGPIHPPTDEIPVWFQADVNFRRAARTGDVVTVTYGSQVNHAHTIEYATNLSGSNVMWVPIGAPTAGNDHFISQQDMTATNAHRFYRLKVEPLPAE